MNYFKHRFSVIKILIFEWLDKILKLHDDLELFFLEEFVSLYNHIDGQNWHAWLEAWELPCFLLELAWRVNKQTFMVGFERRRYLGKSYHFVYGGSYWYEEAFLLTESPAIWRLDLRCCWFYHTMLKFYMLFSYTFSIWTWSMLHSSSCHPIKVSLCLLSCCVFFQLLKLKNVQVFFLLLFIRQNIMAYISNHFMLLDFEE